MSASLAAIPIVDIRAGGPPEHARRNAAQARALRDACLDFFPRATRAALPALDWVARRWLGHAGSSYVAEIAQIAAELKFSGVWFLNASYQWGCTALAVEQEHEPWLVRTLDWPFSGLGRYTAVAHMRGACGDFFSVTWPGYVGALTAMAPRRFAACVNQAPMLRRTLHPWLRPYDFAINALATWVHVDRTPADQLLRRVFEQCGDYAAARRMLESTPVSRAVIYTLVGCAANERCVIERTETGFATREHDTCAANDWVPSRPGWEGRIGTRQFLTSTFGDAAEYSRARREALANWRGSMSDDRFDWVREPVLNPYTRLAVAMSPARGILRAIGYDLTGGNLPEAVTQMCDIAVSAAESGFAALSG